MRIWKNKQAQFYLVTVFILSASVLILTSKIAKTNEPTQEFIELTDNFMEEAAYIINSASYNEYNESEKLQAFAEKFKDQADTKNINLVFLYLLINDKKVTVYNVLGQTVNITKKEEDIALTNENTAVIPTSSLSNNKIMITLEQEYPFTINPGITDLKAIFK